MIPMWTGTGGKQGVAGSGSRTAEGGRSGEPRELRSHGTQRGSRIAAAGMSALLMGLGGGPPSGTAASGVTAAADTGPARPITEATATARPLPRGVPHPEFGLRELASECADCRRVTEADVSALGDLSPGTVVEIGGGPFEETRIEIGGPGTADRPIFVRGADGPPTVVRGVVRIRGSYLIVENLDFDLGSASTGLRVEGHHIALRNVTVRGFRPGRFSTALLAVRSEDVVFTGLHVFDNGDFAIPGEHDVHGVGVAASRRIWLLNSTMHRNRGDGIQLGHRARNTIQEVYIAGNDIHSNGENAVDIKEASDVVISENRLHATPSGHPAVVLHDCPVNAAVLFNEIYDASVGVSLASLQKACREHRPVDLFILRNRIQAIEGHAIQAWGSGKRYSITGNCFAEVGAVMKISGRGQDWIVSEKDGSLKKALERLRDIRGITLSPSDWQQAECGVPSSDTDTAPSSRPDSSSHGGERRD